MREQHQDVPDLGRRIMADSFAIIEHELGTEFKQTLPPWAFAVARRLIHATADFEFATLLRWSPDFESAIGSAFRNRMPVLTDTEMVLIGVRTGCATLPGIAASCHLNDPDTMRMVRETGLTRTAAGIRVAAWNHERPILVVGNAPTALDEAVRLVHEEGWQPSAIIGMPVGFVGVLEAKARLEAQTRVPFLLCAGRKGGSAVAAAALNALVVSHADESPPSTAG